MLTIYLRHIHPYITVPHPSPKHLFTRVSTTTLSHSQISTFLKAIFSSNYSSHLCSIKMYFLYSQHEIYFIPRWPHRRNYFKKDFRVAMFEQASSIDSLFSKTRCELSYESSCTGLHCRKLAISGGKLPKLHLLPCHPKYSFPGGLVL